MLSLNKNWINNACNFEVTNELNVTQFDTLHQTLVNTLNLVDFDNANRGAFYSINSKANKVFMTLKCKSKEIALQFINGRKLLEGKGSCN